MTGSIKTKLRTATVPIVVAALAVGCSDTAAPDQSEVRSSVDATSDLGAAVYAESCASCHGADLRGTDEGPSQLSIVYEPNHHPDGAYRSAIANGAPQHHWSFGDMPPVEGLTSAEVEAVIAFIRAEQQRQGFDQ